MMCGKKDAPEPAAAEGEAEVRESIGIQALIATIGSKMGMKVWVPRGDRDRVEAALEGDDVVLLDSLPLNYDETTIRTIEQIDVLWLKGRAIQRAFRRPVFSLLDRSPLAESCTYTSYEALRELAGEKAAGAPVGQRAGGGGGVGGREDDRGRRGRGRRRLLTALSHPAMGSPGGEH